jgi:ribosomal protein L11 methyltransferase
MRAIVVTVGSADAELASDALWALGVVAVEERPNPQLSGDDTVELWTSLGDGCDERAIGDALTPWSWRFEDVDETVADTWRNFAEPSRVTADLVVVPAWLGYIERDGETALRIDPGPTFGLGDHPTTVLSLRAVRAAITPGDRVFDAGCGSGVLAIAACRFGATSALAVDISPAAVVATEQNADRNGVAELIATSLHWPQPGEVQPFDVVVANILAPVLIEHAELLVAATRQTLIISGLLDGRFDHVVAALAPLVVHSVDTLDGWAAVTLRRPAADG